MSNIGLSFFNFGFAKKLTELPCRVAFATSTILSICSTPIKLIAAESPAERLNLFKNAWPLDCGTHPARIHDLPMFSPSFILLIKCCSDGPFTMEAGHGKNSGTEERVKAGWNNKNNTME